MSIDVHCILVTLSEDGTKVRINPYHIQYYYENKTEYVVYSKIRIGTSILNVKELAHEIDEKIKYSNSLNH